MTPMCIILLAWNAVLSVLVIFLLGRTRGMLDNQCSLTRDFLALASTISSVTKDLPHLKRGFLVNRGYPTKTGTTQP